MIYLLVSLAGAFSTVEEIPENLVHDHEKNGLPRLSSLTPQEITHRYVKRGPVRAGWRAKEYYAYPRWKGGCAEFEPTSH